MTAPRARLNKAGVKVRLPVNDSTLWRAYTHGNFPKPHYIGSRRYWYADEVEAWLDAQMTRPPEARSMGNPFGNRSPAATP